MLSKEEQKAFNQEFWTRFKKKMSGQRSANGRKINWLNYPTEIKSLYLRLHADKKGTALRLDLQFRDAEVRDVYWEQMGELKKVLESEMGTDAQWFEDCSSKEVPHFSRIEWSKEGLNYYQEADQEQIFDFLQEKLLAFDRFYQDYKEILLFLAS
ncbi:MAG: DUF4268 domain-containing protein [Bacteroidetes bacterium]|nr:MAG: DUF4268 domain-containing protein [Bacteroidota bacterium]